MSITSRMQALATLGERLANLSESDKTAIYHQAYIRNNWFTHENIDFAVSEWASLLQLPAIEAWLSAYPAERASRKEVGLIMAGNIPLVGMHDFFSVFLSGHCLRVRLSSKDNFLPRWIFSQLCEIYPAAKEQIFFEDVLKGADAFIATGSNNSSRYFDYYFGQYPSIIRRNRTSVAVLTGKESENELCTFAEDIFRYFGLGCRNVSKIYVPEGYDFEPLFSIWHQEAEQNFKILAHNKYANNYDYNKAIMLMNQDPHLDSGFLLCKESKDLISPMAVLYYEYYKTYNSVLLNIENIKSQLQCVITNPETKINAIPFGKAQKPSWTDYADNIDTMKFLMQLE
ncbi:MAG: acyl-CoA reductase [Bernardetiaceae bacterium]|nr:acyl-CoA reductase [Bernardetiaceae bacterium]